MRRSTWSLSTSISRMPAMRLRGSPGEMIWSRFCFSSSPTRRCGGVGWAEWRSRCGPLCGILHADGGDHRVVLQVVRELHVLLEQRHHAAHRRFDLARGFLLLRQDLHADPEAAFAFFPPPP